MTVTQYQPSSLASKHPWWKEANVYQIYPASFKDSNGDGIGDLPGILSKIDYIQETGADTIWISPMYDSPQHDMGYDISDYEKVYPPYGTNEDMDSIISACHDRGMKLILDLVINHTSDEHAWFKESRSSRTNDKRNWYIWQPAKYDSDGNRKPPNNWSSFFGGSAWEWDETSQEYYLHLFHHSQPDVNFENVEARQAIYKSAMRFWLDKGIDGFRVDVVNLYCKGNGIGFPDAPISKPNEKYQPPYEIVFNGPRMHEYVSEMEAVLSQYPGTKMTVGELALTNGREKVLRYVSAAARQLSMVFQMDVVMVGHADLLGGAGPYDVVPGENWTLPDFTKAVAATQTLLDGSDGWVTTFLENHDQARSVSRWGSDATEESRVRSAKMLALLQTTLSGTLFLYQGQELGMVNAPKEWGIEEYKDVSASNYYEEVKEQTKGDTAALARVMAGLQHVARDNGRIPMSWDASDHGGFSQGDAKPWMRVHDNYKTVNAQKQQSEKDSVWSFWRQMLQTRKAYANSLVHGIFRPVVHEDLDLFVFEKTGTRQKALVALNFSDKVVPLEIPEWVREDETKLIGGTYGDSECADADLRPFEGRLWVSEAHSAMDML